MEIKTDIYPNNSGKNWL